MEGTEQAQPVHSRLNRIVYQILYGALDMEGTERAQPVLFCLNRIVEPLL